MSEIRTGKVINGSEISGVKVALCYAIFAIGLMLPIFSYLYREAGDQIDPMPPAVLSESTNREETMIPLTIARGEYEKTNAKTRTKGDKKP